MTLTETKTKKQTPAEAEVKASEQGAREIQSLPIASVVQIENSRQTYDQEDLSELMTSMRGRGLLSPIGVRRLNDGKWEVVFGNRRLVAATKLGWKYIDAVEVSVRNDEEMLLINAVENMQRVDVPLAEQGRIFHGLTEAGLNEKEIAARIGIPERRVKSVLSVYRELPPEMRATVVKGQPGLRLRGGTIPASTVNRAISMRSRLGLNRSETQSLLKLAKRDGITGMHIGKLAGLIKAGTPMHKAVREIEQTQIVTISIALKKNHIQRLEREKKMKIQDIIYQHLRDERWLGMVQGKKGD